MKFWSKIKNKYNLLKPPREATPGYYWIVVTNNEGRQAWMEMKSHDDVKFIYTEKDKRIEKIKNSMWTLNLRECEEKQYWDNDKKEEEGRSFDAKPPKVARSGYYWIITTDINGISSWKEVSIENKLPSRWDIDEDEDEDDW